MFTMDDIACVLMFSPHSTQWYRLGRNHRSPDYSWFELTASLELHVLIRVHVIIVAATVIDHIVLNVMFAVWR